MPTLDFVSFDLNEAVLSLKEGKFELLLTTIDFGITKENYM